MYYTIFTQLLCYLFGALSVSLAILRVTRALLPDFTGSGLAHSLALSVSRVLDSSGKLTVSVYVARPHFQRPRVFETFRFTRMFVLLWFLAFIRFV